MENSRIIIIDGNSLINRAFYAVPELTNKDGFHTNAIYGFFNMFFKMMDDYDPDYLGVAFDISRKTFRNDQYKEYKANRKGMPEELREQMPVIKKILDSLGVYRMELENYEADDLLGTVSKVCSKKGMEVLIISGDKDILQLADENISVLYTKRGISNLKKYSPKEVEKEFGVPPKRVPDYKGLCGDSSDNIPGVAGIGDKTAKKLLKQFDTIEEIVHNVENIKSTRARNRMVDSEEIALLSKKLATIVTHAPIEFEIEEFKIETPDINKVLDLLKEYDLKSIITRIKSYSNAEVEKKEIDYEIISSKSLAMNLMGEERFSFTTVYDDENILLNAILALAVSTTEHNYYVDFKDENNDILDFKGIFENSSIKKTGFATKKDYLILKRYGIELEGVEFDGFIARYLIDPSRSNYLVSDLVMENFALSIRSEKDLLGTGRKKKTYASLELEELSKFLVNQTYYLNQLKDILLKKLEDENMKDIFYDIELPLIKILADIEFTGFNVNPEELEVLDKDLTQKLDQLTTEIYKLSGEEFNINSPKQLGVILFEKLELPVIKKTKTGYSTSKTVLEKLEKKHEIIPLIKEYRTYQKLKSTYIDGLYNVINEDSNKIHTSLNQTVTATGRLSSTEPNLQNIPMRLPFGRKIRKVFIPSNDNMLIGADYSQIELRVLAHMSQDETLLKAYKESIDIHTLTASQVFNKPLEEVTTRDRSRAKEVNFGIVYGMTDYGLSDRLKISRKEAKEYIDNYFDKYPQVKEFMDQVVEKCKEEHYVTTLFDRKRYIREINDKNFYKRQHANRMAKNTPIQGSAADIIKIAMIRVYNALKEKNLKAKMVLQVHDELILDVPKDEVEIVEKLIREEMEAAVELDVPLKVDVAKGSSWYETK